MTLLFAIQSFALGISYIIKKTSDNFYFKAFFFSILISLISDFYYIPTSTAYFFLQESILILVILILQNENYKILVPSVFAVGFFAISYFISLSLYPEYYFYIIFTLVLIVLFIKIRKHISNYYYLIMYFLLNFLYLNNIEGIIDITYGLKALFLLFIIYNEIASYKEKLTEDKKKIKKLENDFERAVKHEAKRRTFALEKIKNNAIDLSKIDRLTKAYNKKTILHQIKFLIEDRRVPTFSVLFFDIDDFKSINDTFGHNYGDKVLRELSNIILSNKRNTDALGRYGGDEFIILLKGTTHKQAARVARRYKKLLTDQSKYDYTISLGIATFPGDGKTTQELLDIADQGLYQSKEHGKNTISYSGNHYPKI